MYSTSSTTFSDCITTLLEIESRIYCNSYSQSIEELYGWCVSGSQIIIQMAKNATPAHFTDQEVDFIVTLTNMIEQTLIEINGFQNDSYEQEQF